MRRVWGVVLLVGLVVVMLGCGGAVTSPPAAKEEPAKPKHNAMCILCKTKYSIPEEHRGTVAEWTREYPCPNCKVSHLAGSLYQWAEGKGDK